MRYTIEGFSQARLVELGLGYVEAALLRWLVDFAHTGKMKEITDQAGKRLWWVRYDAVAADLPVLGIGNADTMRRRFARLVLSGVLIHQHVNQRGRFSYYGFGPEYESLIADPVHSTEESSETDSDVDHPTRESSEEASEAVHPTAESDETAFTRLESRIPSDSTVGSNDSSSRTQEREDARASSPKDTEHLPPHMAFAVRWYRRFTKATGKLITPSCHDLLAAQEAISRTDPLTLHESIEPYFSREFWFNRDRNTKRPSYSFGSFLAHIPEILAASAEAKPVGPPKGERACPTCGKTLSFGTGRFTRCRCGSAWEIDDRGQMVDVTREGVPA